MEFHSTRIYLFSRAQYVVGNVPFAVERNRRVSVPDLATTRMEDAAFADYALTFSYGRHFDRRRFIPGRKCDT